MPDLAPARERFLSPQELADWLGVPVKTIYHWRSGGEGPPGIRIGRHVRFAEDDVRDWIKAQREDA